MKASHSIRRQFVPTVSLLATAALLLASSRAAAQPVLSGRILIGGPSDAAVDTGFGNYPSGNGFVNGYGYYPDYYYVNAPQLAINSWKWRGPRVVAAPPVADPDAGVAEAAAVLCVRVPADAEVWLSESPTTQRGELRRFVTPPLESGRKQGYAIRARWTENGQAVERMEVVWVHPGDRLTVDFIQIPVRAASR